MQRCQSWTLLAAVFLLTTFVNASRNPGRLDTTVKTSVFHSPPFYLQEGSVENRYYYDIPFPRGHVALKSFDAEVVDEMGVSIPLHETYLHHWVVGRYYGPKGVDVTMRSPEFISGRNQGVCKDTLGQYFGLGSETRKTLTWIPGPYGIEFGNPLNIPSGFEERWYMNVHAIDTRQVKDRLGCTECKCSLYNVTKDEYGYSLGKDYIGGLRCCYDQTQCELSEGFKATKARKLYLRYTVKWAEWDDSIVPVDVYIFDSTDNGKNERYSCLVEYLVEPCDLGVGNEECVDIRKSVAAIPKGGDIVYAVAHQHTGGIGSALYGQDGRELCTSIPKYGDSEEVGNEAGYIVGMSTCYPKPGSVHVSDGELLTVVSNYSNTRQHTGVMGLFYILVAQPQPLPNSILTTAETQAKSVMNYVMNYGWAFAGVAAVAVVAVIIRIRGKYEGEGYQSL